jgi:hypothetical protein
MTNKQGKTLGKKILGVCEVTPTPPLNITMVKIKIGSHNEAMLGTQVQKIH